MNKEILSKFDCIVLDLDGTLVYTSDINEGNGEEISFDDMHGDKISMWVHKRPGFDDFINKCFELGDVGVWSMGQPGYVNAVIKHYFPQSPSFIYNWCHCDRRHSYIYKKLNNIPHLGENILMIDDDDKKLENCERVKIYNIPEWTPDIIHDTELFKLLSYLK